MGEELEAVVGYLFVVDGRAIGAPPPGTLVGLPPRRAPRSRAADTLFVLITMAGEERAPGNVYEYLAQVASDAYFGTSGGVTSALRKAITSVNDGLLKINRDGGHRYEVNLIGAVLRDGEVYLARAGSGLCFLGKPQGVVTFPADLGDEVELYGVPLGMDPTPDVKFTRLDVTSGDVLLMADKTILDISRPDVETALGRRPLEEIIRELRLAVGSRAVMMAVEFLTPEAMPGEVEPTPHVTARREGVTESGAGVPISVPALPSFDVGGFARGIARGVATALAALARGANAILDRLLPEPEGGEVGPRIPGTVAAGAAIVIPLIVVLVIGFLSLGMPGKSQYEQILALAQEEAAQARLLRAQDSEGAYRLWESVLQHLEQAEHLYPGDPAIESLRGEALIYLDDYYRVTRCPVALLRRYPEGAQLIGPVLHGIHLYVLDVTRSAVYQDMLAEAGNALVEGATAPVIQRGSAVGEIVVDDIVDIAWMVEGGVPRGNVLVGLDVGNGALISYSPTFPPPTAQILPGKELWQRPVAVAVWGGNFYILDRDANQIWRYVRTGDSYGSPPEPYFEEDMPRDLSRAVDLAIDESGYVYVLNSDGSLYKFWGGEPQAFEFTDMPRAFEAPVSMYLDSNPLSQALYVVDSGPGLIYETTLAGQFLDSFAPSDPDAFSDITGVAIAPGAMQGYVVAGRGLYVFSIPERVSP